MKIGVTENNSMFCTTDFPKQQPNRVAVGNENKVSWNIIVPFVA